jgi:hypothetical protein
MTVSINGTSGLVFNDASTQNTSAFTGGFAFRNRIINGAMVIDQRNAGASVTLTSGGVYTVDRWQGLEDTDGSMTAQQSTTAPAGFTNSLVCTTTSADASLGATQFAVLQQKIEGFNIYDLGWGTASAQSVTLSFQVYSSLTGTFGGALQNSAQNRSYPFSYSIPVANTWTTISVTIAGDTSGTWLTTSGIGVRVIFGLGVGATYSGTAGSWSGNLYLSATSAVSVVGTNGATFYITGVQLEKGSTATSFDYRPYGTELQLCQRYLPAFNRQSNDIFGVGQSTSATTGLFFIPFQVTPRVVPTGVTTSTASDFYVVNTAGTVGYFASSIAFSVGGAGGASVNVTYANNGGSAGQANALYSNVSGAKILFTGCEL